MYKLSKNTNLNFLNEQQLEMLCFAAYSLYLHFSDDIIITVEGSFEHIVGSGRKRAQHSFPIGASELTRLLSSRVKSVSVTSDTSLQLKFSNGDGLILKGDSGPYESYQIQHRGEHTVV